MKLRKSLTPFLTLCCLYPASEVQGQQRDNPDKGSNAKIAIVALGPKPTRKYSKPEDGGDALMRLAQPDETPPPRLYHRISKGKDDKWIPVNIAFNNPSALREIPSDRELSLYRKHSGDGHYEPYVTLPAVPATMRAIFFLIPRTYDSAPWKEPPRIKAITLEDSRLMDKNFILANFSEHAVQHAFEDKVETVSNGKILTYRQQEGPQLYRLAARYGKERKTIYNTAVRLSQDGHVLLFVLYKGSPATNAGREIGVFRMVIPAREEETDPEKRTE